MGRERINAFAGEGPSGGDSGPGTDSRPVVLILAAALFLGLLVVAEVVTSAMQGIFVVALYSYARTGTVPHPFEKGTVEKAFVPREPAFGAGNI